MSDASELLAYWLTCEGTEFRETLQDHVSACVEALTELSESGLGRLVSVRVGVSPEVFRDVMIAAATLHDIGKAFFQGNNVGCRRRGKRCVCLSFVGHEWLSAYFANKLRMNYLMRLKDELGELLDVAVFSILYHHHAMGLLRRGERVPHSVNLGQWDIPQLKQALTPLVRHLPTPALRDAYLATVEEAVPKLASQSSVPDTVHYAQKVDRELWRDLVSKPGRRILYLGATAALVAADYAAAGRNREAPTSGFSEVVKEFLLTYVRKAPELKQLRNNLKPVK